MENKHIGSDFDDFLSVKNRAYIELKVLKPGSNK